MERWKLFFGGMGYTILVLRSVPDMKEHLEQTKFSLGNAKDVLSKDIAGSE